MKRKDLKSCAMCGKGLMHSGSPMFYKIKIESMIFDTQVLQQQAGLEMMLGSPELASIMGPDGDIAKKAAENEILICMECAIKPISPAYLMEIQ